MVVALAWLTVAVAGVATAPTTLDRHSFDFALPGQPAHKTSQRIVEQYGGGPGRPRLGALRTPAARGRACGYRQARSSWSQTWKTFLSGSP